MDDVLECIWPLASYVVDSPSRLVEQCTANKILFTRIVLLLEFSSHATAFDLKRQLLREQAEIRIVVHRQILSAAQDW